MIKCISFTLLRPVLCHVPRKPASVLWMERGVICWALRLCCLISFQHLSSSSFTSEKSEFWNTRVGGSVLQTLEMMDKTFNAHKISHGTVTTDQKVKVCVSFLQFYYVTHLKEMIHRIFLCRIRSVRPQSFLKGRESKNLTHPRI